MEKQPTALVLYHFFHLDDVVSAQQFADLRLGFHARSWQMTVLPSNRSCHDPRTRYPGTEDWQGVRISRITPPFPKPPP